MATQAEYEQLGVWASMLHPTDIDRHNDHRTVPMEVLSLGLPRTGTASMQEALDMLGYPTYHFSKVFANPRDADIWIPALEAKNRGDRDFDFKQAFDHVLGDCRAVTDVPTVVFWKELLEAYPKAKVILVERDEDRWVKSFEGLLGGVLIFPLRRIFRYTDPSLAGRINRTATGWTQALVGTDTSMEKAMSNARGAYRSHYANIRATVPKDRILEYKLGSSWEPLCKFLGKDVPDVPFPHRNEAASLDKGIGVFLKNSVKNSLFNVGAVVGLGVVLVAVWQRFGL